MGKGKRSIVSPGAYISKYQITGMVHITGGGLIENPPRILPKGCAMKIDKRAWKRPAIFNLFQKKGNISEKEMLRTFNCGLGILVVSRNNIKEGILVGEIIKGNRNVIF